MGRKGRLLGYARVSTEDQELGLQLDALERAGVAPDDVFQDRGVSGAISERPGLSALLDAVQSGDTVVVWRLDRLGRSVLHLATLLEDFRVRKVRFRSLSEGVDLTTATGRMMLTILGSLAEFERELIRERTNAGLAAARRRGKVLGRKPRLTLHQKQEAARLIAEGQSYAEVGRLFNVDKSVVWRAVNAKTKV